MKKLSFNGLTTILLSFITQVRSESYNASFGRTCSVTNNRLAPDTNQFLSDCGYAAWCDPDTNTCQKNGCRKDEYPFGMGPKSVSSVMKREIGGCKWPDKQFHLMLQFISRMKVQRLHSQHSDRFRELQ